MVVAREAVEIQGVELVCCDFVKIVVVEEGVKAEVYCCCEGYWDLEGELAFWHGLILWETNVCDPLKKAELLHPQAKNHLRSRLIR